jgi:hypothetical protein
MPNSVSDYECRQATRRALVEAQIVGLRELAGRAVGQIERRLEAFKVASARPAAWRQLLHCCLKERGAVQGVKLSLIRKDGKDMRQLGHIGPNVVADKTGSMKMSKEGPWRFPHVIPTTGGQGFHSCVLIQLEFSGSFQLIEEKGRM